jgi:hypothetical protein
MSLPFPRGRAADAAQRYCKAYGGKGAVGEAALLYVR